MATWKQIETSREIRMWIRQIIVPALAGAAVGFTLLYPDRAEEVKDNLVTIFNKKSE